MQYSTWTTWVAVVPWWYTVLSGRIRHHQGLLFLTIVDYFSFKILLRTLFEPWKRDQLSTERLSLQDRVQVWALNAIARLFGFVLRSGAISVGLVSLVVTGLFFLTMWLSWLLAPLVGLVLVGLGLFTIAGGIQ